MAVAKRTVTKYARRRYARYGYRRYRGLSNQYFKAKVEGVYTIAWPTENGGPIFAEANGPSLTFGAVFSSSQYYGSLVNMFGYFKVTGVLMEVVPGPWNNKGTAAVGQKTFVGFKCGTSTTMNYHELVASNTSIMLGVNTSAKKYSSTMGSAGWVSASGNIDDVGNFSVGSSFVQGTTERQATWTVKLSLYMVLNMDVILKLFLHHLLQSLPHDKLRKVLLTLLYLVHK